MKLEKALIKPIIIPRKEHSISRKNISKRALKVLYRLHHEGFEAYLVGGGVRDLLLGHQPKDFDIVTNAKPEEVQALFDNCRLIGRRFRLAHIYFGKEIIEVATFRAGGEEPLEGHLEHSEEGLILRDNIYGSLEEDVWRRDFTANALYYNINGFSLVDFVGGMQDIQNKELRLIGDPIVRYREDPVRMLRAIRFAEKLHFSIHLETSQPIKAMASLLQHIAPARLFEEYAKLFLYGHGLSTYHRLREYQLFEYLFPQATVSLNGPSGTLIADFFELALKNTDARIHEGKHISPAFLLAVFLWPSLQQAVEKWMKENLPIQDALHTAIDEIFQIQRRTLSVPKRWAMVVREIWILQWRFPKRTKLRVKKLLSHPKVRAAYDFLELRAQAGEPHLQANAAWWKDYLEGSEHTRKEMEHALEAERRNEKRKKHRKKKQMKPPLLDGEPLSSSETDDKAN